MNKKKILWIILLVVLVVAVVVGIIIARPQENNVEPITNTAQKTTTSSASTTTMSRPSNELPTANSNKTTLYKEIELDDGVLYSIDGKQVEADFVVGDNYFDTTISDMYLNPGDYANKKIEIEGMYLINSPYTFVGRFSTSNMCAYCPTGYSYIEYQLNGKIDREFTDQQEWIKIIGTLEKGNDASSYYSDYYYINVLTLEVMNERGQETVNN